MVEKFCKCGKISRFLICNFFEYLFGILSEIVMCEIIFFGLLGNVEIVELLRNIGIVAFICIMVM